LIGGRGGHSEEAVGVALFVVVGGRDLGVPGQGVAAANAPRSWAQCVHTLCASLDVEIRSEQSGAPRSRVQFPSLPGCTGKGASSAAKGGGASTVYSELKGLVFD